jgi:hypothetical protein
MKKTARTTSWRVNEVQGKKKSDYDGLRNQVEIRGLFYQQRVLSARSTIQHQNNRSKNNAGQVKNSKGIAENSSNRNENQVAKT